MGKTASEQAPHGAERFVRGETVLTSHPRTASLITLPVLAGSVVAVDPNGSYWIDLNNYGVHLPQLYWADELVRATPELAGHYVLCGTCAGYGIAISGDACPVCQGSGSAKYRLRRRAHDAVLEEYEA